MNKYEVTFRANATEVIEAETEEEARERAGDIQIDYVETTIKRIE